MVNSKRVTALLGVLICILLFFSQAAAEKEYSREKAEELFHLIQWHEYRLETFQKALDEQKPLYLVLSAPAWCYWCHVYESEDYLYHPDLYPYINKNFIAIFIDSDKRPDLTKKYIEGGWPSTTILTPDLKRINGFSGPVDPSQLKDYLVRIVDFLKDKSFYEADKEVTYREVEPKVPEEKHLDEIENAFLEQAESVYDSTYGGFIQGGSGQKFPTGLTYTYLLEKYEETGRAEYLQMVQTSFDNQYTDISGLKDKYRLYDPIEGGFHRYSTKEDWSIPHYEKMLGDQAKLLRAYAHLLKLTGESRVQKSVDGTVSFIREKFFDEKGGFYSSQDAYLEENYYGLTEEERADLPPPYIDKTRTIDANALMVGTFLSLHELFGNDSYREIAERSLDFLNSSMIGNDGAYYYYDYAEDNPRLTGQALSNSWAMLAFIEGYSLLNKREYLVAAQRIAEYSLNNLYDWNSGGFFERNSSDSEFYAPFEQIDLTKPYGENAVFSYGFLRLHQLTKKLEYLESGLKTLGYILGASPPGMEDVYYVIKAARLVKKDGLLSVYEQNLGEIALIADKGKSNFFLFRKFMTRQESPAPEEAPVLKDDVASAGFVVLAVLAFLAGILSFLSPCTLPILPAYFAQGFHAGKGEILKNTVFFFLGLATVFSLFGMGATIVGGFLREYMDIFTKAAGILIIVLGTLEIFGKGFSGLNIYLKGNHKTPLGSYIFGSFFAVGWSACIGPVLASLLLLSAASATVLKGTSLLFIYALGLAVPLMVVSLFFDRIRSNRFWEFMKGRELSFSLFNRQMVFHSTYLISGVILILLGIFIYNDYLYKLNQFTLKTEYVQEIIIKGEEFLKKLFVR